MSVVTSALQRLFKRRHGSGETGLMVFDLAA
jgi:hypothetical protein